LSHHELCHGMPNAAADHGVEVMLALEAMYRMAKARHVPEKWWEKEGAREW